MFDLPKICSFGRNGRKLLHLPVGFDNRMMSVRCSNEFNFRYHQPSGIPKTKLQEWPVIDFDLPVDLTLDVF